MSGQRTHLHKGRSWRGTSLSRIWNKDKKQAVILTGITIEVAFLRVGNTMDRSAKPKVAHSSKRSIE